MAGDDTRPGHHLVSGEEPSVGLEVITNNLDRGRIVRVAEGSKCGWYCEAWHDVELHTSYRGEPLSGVTQMNCDRLTTQMPRRL